MVASLLFSVACVDYVVCVSYVDFICMQFSCLFGWFQLIVLGHVVCCLLLPCIVWCLWLVDCFVECGKLVVDCCSLFVRSSLGVDCRLVTVVC